MKAYEDERKIAATALFRLAEIRGKEDDKTEAVRLLKRLLVEFPGVYPQQKIATEKLKALDEDVPATGDGIASPELKAIEDLRKLAETSPDVCVDEKHVQCAARNGWSRSLDYVLESQGLAALRGGLESSVSVGNLEITKLLIEAGVDPNSEGAFGLAVEKGFEAVIVFLIEKGADPNLVEFEGDVSALHLAVWKNSPEIVKALLKAGANPGYKTSTLIFDNGVAGSHSEVKEPIPVRTKDVTNPELIIPLLNAGAKVHDFHWQFLSAEKTLQWNREPNQFSEFGGCRNPA